MFKRVKMVGGTLFLKDGLTSNQEHDLLQLIRLSAERCVLVRTFDISTRELKSRIIVRAKENVWNELTRLSSVCYFRKASQ